MLLLSHQPNTHKYTNIQIYKDTNTQIDIHKNRHTDMVTWNNCKQPTYQILRYRLLIMGAAHIAALISSTKYTQTHKNTNTYTNTQAYTNTHTDMGTL